ncbi:DMP19 family protein [Geodermatophilus sp. SYSU D00698]
MADPADRIWDRACDPDVPATHPGDAALAAVLLCHGMAMNGGLLHAVEGLGPGRRAAAVTGFRLLGLDAAADAVEDVAREAAALREDDADAAERLEVEAGRRYDAALPEWDETIDRAFRAHLAAHPGAYAPAGDVP